MLKIAITPERLDELNEARQIRALIRSGWDRVHLRHPGATLAEMKRLIEAIPQEMHGRLTIHGHFDLACHFNLGGLHLNRRCPAPPVNYRGGLSRSCHSIDEVMECAEMDYVTLSPVFDSISKHGYEAAYSPDELSRLACAPTKVIALGGITPGRIGELRRYNFAGFAMLGALPWDGDADDMAAFAAAISEK